MRVLRLKGNSMQVGAAIAQRTLTGRKPIRFEDVGQNRRIVVQAETPRHILRHGPDDAVEQIPYGRTVEVIQELAAEQRRRLASAVEAGPVAAARSSVQYSRSAALGLSRAIDAVPHRAGRLRHQRHPASDGAYQSGQEPRGLLYMGSLRGEPYGLFPKSLLGNV